ncbi:hypothetical protein Esi_0012_0027 [Ectocarpus siliculosus]|uniref:Uncharacterized protein n=1 Tax=Ectocarpus siliculosus TaxID=2880 RepID=D8LDF1_ECTSI|nr:hypothetical protein Esi_0012_0027 [Ectocarpus siliculosus]|eukprot:CBN74016.1 hypothetical protein Esi_0012_0027 [Ectocarpus siliculosus]
MNIGTGPEADFRDGCLSLRASTLDKIRASQSPGFSGQVPNGLGRQPLSNFRTQPVVGWGHYTDGINDKGRPVETLNGKNTPGPQYELDKVTCGQQVQSRFKTAPTPVFGSSQRPPLNGEGCVSPGPMTATVNVSAQPPGPKYSMAGAPWRKKTKAPKSPGPGQYNVYGSLGEQKESTRTSFKGFGFGGSGVARDMALPSRKVPGPGHYSWHEKDRPSQPGGKFGQAPQRPQTRGDLRPAPGQYSIPSTLGTTMDSRFRTVVAPGFGTPPPIDEQRPHSAAGRLGGGPGPGAYDVGRVDSLAVQKKPLSTEKSCLSFQIKPPTSVKPNVSRERKMQELDPESLRRAIKSTRKGCRVPNVSFGVGPQRPVDNPGKCPGPQAYDPENLRRAVSACKSSPTRGVKFGTGPQRHNTAESDKSPGPNAGYFIPSTLGAQQTNSMFESVKTSSFGPPPNRSSRRNTPVVTPGPSDYNPTSSNMAQTTHALSFGGATPNSKGGGARGMPRRSSSPGPGAYSIGSGLGVQTSSKYPSSTGPSFRAR